MGLGTAVTIAALTWTGVSPAATEVPRVTHLRAVPSTFCAKRTSTCSHPGTSVRFSISTNAKVRIDIRPRFEYDGSFVEYVGRRNQGANSVRLQDGRLRRGRWTIRVQATNNVGTGPIAVTDVHVVGRG